MKIKIKNITSALIVCLGFSFAITACNSSEEYLTTLPSSATIRSFSLAENKDILPNLDSVFFSIDLNTLEIFNADSLPYGTKITSLQPVILTESASYIEVLYTDSQGEEHSFNYLENTTDTVNFSQPVKVRVVSYDGMNECKYTVRVNVHNVPVDTMVWSRLENGTLPTVFNAVNEQHTSMASDGIYYCMTSYQNEYAVAYSSDPSGNWNGAKVVNGADFDLNSFTAAPDALYILDKNGVLFVSKNKGLDWEKSEVMAKSLLGVYAGRLLATTQTGNVWRIIEYPSGLSVAAPAAFPVLNTSTAVNVSFEMSVAPQMLITGGRKADGTLTGDTWGFDGNTWINVSKRPLPEKLENLALVPYFDLVPDTISWKVSPATTVLLAMTGNRADGTPNDTVYMTRDFGMTWHKADVNMQIPTSIIPSRTKAQAFPYTGIIQEKPANIKIGFSVISTSWSETGFGRQYAKLFKGSRASDPITEWDVPYIYLFGGVNSQGATYNTVFRGVITAFTQKPLQ